MELAAPDHNGSSRDLHRLDPGLGASSPSEEHAGAADLVPLRDFNLFAEGNEAVTSQMARQRARRGSRGRVFRHAKSRREHPRLPSPTRPCKAVRSDLSQLQKRCEVGPHLGNLVLTLQGDIDVSDSVVIDLDWKARLEPRSEERRVGKECRL